MTEGVRAIAVNKVYPDGMKTEAIRLELPEAMKPDEWKKNSFEVWDYSYEPAVKAINRTITEIICQDEKTVILKMDIREKAAYAIGNYKMDGSFDPFGPGQLGFKNPEQEDRMPKPDEKGRPKGPGKDFGYTGPKPLCVEVRIRNQEGKEERVRCTDWICPELDRFQVIEWEGQKYLLFVPETYEGGQKYPLILFIPDAAGRGTYEKNALTQGTGALVWTEPEEQKKHPCFVMAPVYGPEDILTHDDFTFDTKIYRAKEFIDKLQKTYPVDPKRIYTTGQSMGCMSSCQLMIHYPDYFAGALLVAGQWEPVQSGKALKDKKVWILVSENDRKAHPGMDAVTEAIEACGGCVARFLLDAKQPWTEIEREAGREAAAPEPVKYTLFAGSSVVPDGVADGPGSNHTCTWQIAYQIEAVRDWLLGREEEGTGETI